MGNRRQKVRDSKLNRKGKNGRQNLEDRRQKANKILKIKDKKH